MKKRILLGLAVCLVIAISFFGFTSNTQNEIQALGYSEEETSKLIEEYGIFNAAAKTEKALEDEIKDKEETLKTEIGLEPSLIEGRDKMTRVAYSKELTTFTDEMRTTYTADIEAVNTELAKYNVEDTVATEGVPLAKVLTDKTTLLETTVTNYETEIENHKTTLLDFGMRESELEALLTGDLVVDLKALQDKVAYYEEYQALVSTSGNSYASGAMDLFNILNNHRVSKGLPAFTYNSAQQSCVDIEANSYANNKNPHNWLCKTLTSEGASLASVNSDYIQIAGNFLTTHGSHEADVVNPNYTSAACSAVQRDNMVYMICGYFQ